MSDCIAKHERDPREYDLVQLAKVAQGQERVIRLPTIDLKAKA